MALRWTGQTNFPQFHHLKGGFDTLFGLAFRGPAEARTGILPKKGRRQNLSIFENLQSLQVLDGDGLFLLGVK